MEFLEKLLKELNEKRFDVVSEIIRGEGEWSLVKFNYSCKGDFISVNDLEKVVKKLMAK